MKNGIDHGNGKRRPGRRRKLGQRYRSGDLRRANGDARAPTLWRRIKDHAIRVGVDRRMGTEVGRLAIFGQLTDHEVAAAFLMAEIYGRYENAEGLCRAPRSPAYEIGYGSGGGDSPTQEKRTRKARKQFERLQKVLPTSAVLRAVLEQVCVEDRPVLSFHLPRIKNALAAVAHEFGAGCAPSPCRRTEFHPPT